MRNLIFFICLLFCVDNFHAVAADVHIIPKPEKVKLGKGTFVFSNQSTISFQDQSQERAASDLIKYLDHSARISLKKTQKQGLTNVVIYKSNNSFSPESYRLKVNSHQILIEASSESGFFYATQSLLQLLPTEIFSNSFSERLWSIPAVTIEDSPKYAYRGVMLDVARYFTPKEEILKLLDYLSMHKINKFHWHLVDDNGWRIEIKKYPLLTSVGAFRVDRESIFPMRSNPEQGEPTPVGGYYTQQDIREIVAYAQERQIEVIPEIEMPAHTNSSLAAYPNLTCSVVNHFLGTLPGIGGKNASAIYCAGKDEVFEFLQDVIDEVSELFPSQYIHIGGDEAWKDNWKKCPDCQKRMKDNNIPNEEELQSYFIRRMNQYLKMKNKKLMGWDELVDSEIPENATIFAWRGLGQSAAKAIQKGHQVVLTPARKLYLIRYQGPQWFEPYTYFGNNTLADVYDYDPSMSGISSDQESKVLGLQASMWTEFITTSSNLEYMLFPRVAALADIAWSKHPRDWSNFLTRLDHMTEIYENRNISYSSSMFNLFHDVKATDGDVFASLSCIRPDVKIRYTLDGSVPTVKSPVYRNGIKIPKSTFLQAVAFKDNKMKGKVLKINPVHSLSIGKKISGDKASLDLLLNGILGSEKFTDGEYLDIYDQDLNFIIDFGKSTEFSHLALSTLLNSGMGVYFPERISVALSENGIDFTNECIINIPEKERFVHTFQKDRIEIPYTNKQKARYVRFDIKRPGVCPAGYHREGQPSRMVFDEVLVN